MARARKIAIVGNVAGGKSTLAKRLALRLGLPLFHVDEAFWLINSRRPYHAYRRDHRGWLMEDDWVIDGWGPPAELAERLDRADVIVFIDHALTRHLYWALRRRATERRSAERMPSPSILDLVRTTVRVHRQLRPELLTMLAYGSRRSTLIYIRGLAALRRMHRIVSDDA